MIKKPVFENELIWGMHQELVEFDKTASSDDLVKAADYLYAALEIFEEAGMTAHADNILNILTKIAIRNSNVTKMPALQALFDAGITQEDFKNFGKGQPFAKLKINQALRNVGLTDDQIGELIGKENVITEKDVEEYGPSSHLGKILRMIEEPEGPVPEAKELHPEEKIDIESIASHHKMPKDPRKISDRHTKGLTPEKQVRNLLDHGTQFNLADDGQADDLLNLEINDGLEVTENKVNPEMDFEDEI